MSCNGEDGHLALDVQATYGWSATTLRLSDGTSADTVRRAVSLSLAWRKSETMTLEGVVGAALPGSLTIDDGGDGKRPPDRQRYDLRPGGLLGVAASWRVVDGRAKRPFVLIGLSMAASLASTGPTQTDSAAAFASIDFRGSLTVGKTFFDTMSPYAALRLFGGPVIWSRGGQAIGGTDAYHVQVGAGLVTALPRAFNLFAEIDPLGERAVTVGGGRSF